jgi:hypothetical protein
MDCLSRDDRVHPVLDAGGEWTCRGGVLSTYIIVVHHRLPPSSKLALKPPSKTSATRFTHELKIKSYSMCLRTCDL